MLGGMETEIALAKQMKNSEKPLMDEEKSSPVNNDGVTLEYNTLKVCEISLRGSNNEYISMPKESVMNYRELRCDGQIVTVAQRFLSIPIAKNKIKLKSVECNKYLQVSSNRLLCIQEPHFMLNHVVFDLIRNDDGTFSLRSDGKFISLDSKNSSKINVSSTSSIGNNQKFRINVIKNAYDPSKLCQVSLYNVSNAAFITTVEKVHGDKAYVEAICKYPDNKPFFSTFTSIPITTEEKTDDEGDDISTNKQPDTIILRSYFTDNYLLSPSNEKEITSFVCDSYIKSEATQFEVIPVPNKTAKYLLKSQNSEYLSARENMLNYEHNESEACEWEIKPIQHLRFSTTIILTHFGNIDTSQQSFRVTALVFIVREMTKRELISYIASPQEFEPSFQICLQLKNTEEIVENTPWVLENMKEFIVEWNDELNCYTVKRRITFTADFIEGLELENFPFDVQHFSFPLIFRTPSVVFDINENGDEIELSLLWVGESSKCGYSSSEPFGWSLSGLQTTSAWFDFPSYPGHWEEFSIVLQRKWQFYFRTVIVGLFIISLITMAIFLAVDAADRLGFISGMFLTAVAYLFISSEYLPEISYLTLLDEYIYFIMIDMLLITFLICVEARFDKFGSSQHTDEEMDNLMFLINFIAWLVFHIYFIIRSVRAYRNESRKMDQGKAEFDAEHPTSGNSFYEFFGIGNDEANETEYGRFWGTQNLIASVENK